MSIYNIHTIQPLYVYTMYSMYLVSLALLASDGERVAGAKPVLEMLGRAEALELAVHHDAQPGARTVTHQFRLASEQIVNTKRIHGIFWVPVRLLASSANDQLINKEANSNSRGRWN